MAAALKSPGIGRGIGVAAYLPNSGAGRLRGRRQGPGGRAAQPTSGRGAWWIAAQIGAEGPVRRGRLRLWRQAGSSTARGRGEAPARDAVVEKTVVVPYLKGGPGRRGLCATVFWDDLCPGNEERSLPSKRCCSTTLVGAFILRDDWLPKAIVQSQGGIRPEHSRSSRF